MYFEGYYLPPKPDYYILVKSLRLTILYISPLLPVKHPSLPCSFTFIFLICRFIAVQCEMISPSCFLFNQFRWQSFSFNNNFIFLQNLIQKNLYFMTLFFLLAYAGAEHIIEALFNVSYCKVVGGFM